LPNFFQKVGKKKQTQNTLTARRAEGFCKKSFGSSGGITTMDYSNLAMG